MGVLIDGKWRDEELPQETAQSGAFQRTDSIFRNVITADGSSGFKAEAGRYHLYVAYGCPWAHRTLIFRALKKLEKLRSASRLRHPQSQDARLDLRRESEFPRMRARSRQRLPLSARGL